MTFVDGQTAAKDRGYVAPWVRVAILVTSVLTAISLSWWATGSLVPTNPKGAAIFQSSLLLVVFGSAILEHKFTRPADSAVNAMAGIVTLVTIFSIAPKGGWWIVLAYCALVLVLSLICVSVSTGESLSPRRQVLARRTYGPAVALGKARVLFSVLFLFGIFSFYSSPTSREAAVFIVFWGVFMAIWPLRLPEFLSSLVRSDRAGLVPLGRVIRREWPDLLRVELNPGVSWSSDSFRLYQDADGVQHLVVPLYKNVRGDLALGTGLCISYEGERQAGLTGGVI